jgi:hypothetical protein
MWEGILKAVEIAGSGEERPRVFGGYLRSLF